MIQKKIPGILLIICSILLIYTANAYTWEFTIDGTLSETIDDNVNATAGNQEYDFVTTLLAGLGIENEGKTYNFSLLAHIYQDIYIRETSLTTNSQDVVVMLTKNFSELTSFSVQNVFHHYPEPRTYDYAFGLTGGRNTYFSNITTCSFQTQPLRVFSLSATYVYGLTEYQDDALIDSRYHSGGGNFGYYWSSANYTYVGYNFTYTIYSTGEQIPFHSAFIGHTHYFTRQLYANVHAGADYTISAEGSSYSPNAMFSLIDDVDENNQINLTFTYGVAMNPYLDETFENWNISLNFTRQVLNRLSFALITFYGRGLYRESGTRNSLFGLTTNLSYEIKEDVYGSVSYNLTRNGTQVENANEISYFRNRITIALTASL